MDACQADFQLLAFLRQLLGKISIFSVKIIIIFKLSIA